MLLVSRKTIAERAAATPAVVVRVGHGRYDLRELVKGFARHMRERDRGGDAAAVTSVAAQRARKLRLECDRLEREDKIAAGKLLDWSAWEAALTASMRCLRGSLLALPKRIPGLDRHQMVAAAREVHEMLTELAASRPYAGHSFEGFDRVAGVSHDAP